MVQSTLFPLNHPKLLGSTNPSEKSNSEPLSSIRFLNATTVNISASVNRSTISAQVIWNRLSFSNFLNTLPLISTN